MGFKVCPVKTLVPPPPEFDRGGRLMQGFLYPRFRFDLKMLIFAFNHTTFFWHVNDV